MNDQPVAEDLSFEVLSDEVATGQLIAADLDGDALSFSLDPPSGPVEGDVVIASDGSFTYTPDTAFDAVDSFRYRVDDGSGGFAFGSITVTIDSVSEGSAAADEFTGDGAADLFNGGGGDDTLSGGGGGDTLTGGGGKDELTGNGGKDLLQGNGGRNVLKGGGGEDTLEGGGGNDVLDGGGGKDVLDGQGGRDTMSGGGGKDDIFGGRGSDVLTGGGGSDRFIFDRGNGKETITDFQQGRDKIVVEGGANTFADLQITQIGADVRILIGNTRVTVEDDQSANFTANDFIF